MAITPGPAVTPTRPPLGTALGLVLVVVGLWAPYLVQRFESVTFGVPGRLGDAWVAVLVSAMALVTALRGGERFRLLPPVLGVVVAALALNTIGQTLVADTSPQVQIDIGWGTWVTLVAGVLIAGEGVLRARAG